MPKRMPRTIDNDLRLLANYSRRLQKIADRITPEEVAALDDNDLGFLLGWTEGLGITLSNLALDCQSTFGDRHDTDGRRMIAAPMAEKPET